MQNLIRAGSFSRRSKRAEEAGPKSSVAGQVVGKIVRTASFGRRNSRRAPRAEERTDTEDSASRGESSDSRAATPDKTESPVQSPGVAEPVVFQPRPILQDRLHGWLRKKHHKGSWAKRYFFVDEQRGTLGYSKTVSGRRAKPSVVLPLADITRIEADDSFAREPNAFVIRCPPIHLTVAAISEKERKNWMQQLELRMEIWRVKQAEKMPAANVGALIAEEAAKRPDADEGSDDPPRRSRRGGKRADAGADGYQAGTSSHEASPTDRPTPPSPPAHDVVPATREEVLEPRPPKTSPEGSGLSRARGATTSGAAVPSAAAVLPPAPRPAADADDVPGLPDAPPDAPPIPPRAGAADLGGGAEAADVDCSPLAKEARRGGRRIVGAGAIPRDEPGLSGRSPSEVETVELYSGDEDEEGDEDEAEVNSANRAVGGERGGTPEMRGPAPVPLAAMISSDEEEDDDDHAPAAPRHRAVRRSPPLELHDDEIEAEAAPVRPPSPPSPGIDRWDSEEEEEAALHAHSPSRWSAEQSDAALAYAPASPDGLQASSQQVMVGDGIVADVNFAEDDWDADDD